MASGLAQAGSSRSEEAIRQSSGLEQATHAEQQGGPFHGLPKVT